MKSKILSYFHLNKNVKTIHDLEIVNFLSTIYPEIQKKTKALELKTKAAMFVLDLESEPCCVECNNPIEFSKVKETLRNPVTIFGGWKDFCSVSCSRKSSLVNLKRQNTLLNKYGVSSYAKTEQFKQVFSKPWSEKKKRNFNDKVKETSKSKYGVEHFSKTDDYLKTRTETNQKLYGVNNTFELVDKIKETNLERYGEEYYSRTIEGRKRLSDNNAMKKSEIALKSLLNRRNNSLESEELKEILNSNNKELLLKIINENQIKFRYDLTKYFKISNTYMRLILQKFDLLDIFGVEDKRITRGHLEVCRFLDDIKVSYTVNQRSTIKDYELDIVIPDKNLAIEYNGIYWHSELGGKDSDYHLNKTELCESKGIQLLHIFESEWDDFYKQEIWKSIIKAKLKMFDRIIYARKCIIKDVLSSEARKFFDQNHLSGFVNARWYKGLYYENELVCCISVGQSRFKKNEYEIIRFASTLNTNVIGGFSRLLKLFSHLENLVSFADRRISSTLNSVYYKHFDKVEITSPNWFVVNFKEGVLHSRIKFQKHKLKDLLDNYDENKTSIENIHNNNYYRIWDSGNLKFSQKRSRSSFY